MKPDGWDDVGARVGFSVGCAYVGIALGKSEGFAKKKMQIMFFKFVWCQFQFAVPVGCRVGQLVEGARLGCVDG